MKSRSKALAQLFGELEKDQPDPEKSSEAAAVLLGLFLDDVKRGADALERIAGALEKRNP